MTSSTERQRRADVNDRYGHHYVDNSPDVRPAVRLRKELERDREQGFIFDQVFDDEIEWAVADLGLGAYNAEQWRQAFMATEAAWRSAYERTEPSVSSLHVGLLSA